MSEALLEDLISRHKFMVVVTTAEENKYLVSVDFAAKRQVYYEVNVDEEYNDVDGFIYSNISNQDDQETSDCEAIEEYVPLPALAIRLYILLDIYRQCRELGLPLEIVRFFDSAGSRTEFMEMLQLPLSDEEVAAEACLNDAIHHVLNKEVDPNKLNAKLEEVGLLHSFLLLRGLL